jgi:hypothetical protein
VQKGPIRNLRCRNAILKFSLRARRRCRVFRELSAQTVAAHYNCKNKSLSLSHEGKHTHTLTHSVRDVNQRQKPFAHTMRHNTTHSVLPAAALAALCCTRGRKRDEASCTLRRSLLSLHVLCEPHRLGSS